MTYGCTTAVCVAERVVVALTLVISGMEAVCREGTEAVGGWSGPRVMREMEVARAREQVVSRLKTMSVVG